MAWQISTPESSLSAKFVCAFRDKQKCECGICKWYIYILLSNIILMKFFAASIVCYVIIESAAAVFLKTLDESTEYNGTLWMVFSDVSGIRMYM